MAAPSPARLVPLRRRRSKAASKTAAATTLQRQPPQEYGSNHVSMKADNSGNATATAPTRVVPPKLSVKLATGVTTVPVPSPPVAAAGPLARRLSETFSAHTATAQPPNSNSQPAPIPTAASAPASDPAPPSTTTTITTAAGLAHVDAGAIMTAAIARHKARAAPATTATTTTQPHSVTVVGRVTATRYAGHLEQQQQQQQRPTDVRESGQEVPQRRLPRTAPPEQPHSPVPSLTNAVPAATHNTTATSAAAVGTTRNRRRRGKQTAAAAATGEAPVLRMVSVPLLHIVNLQAKAAASEGALSAMRAKFREAKAAWSTQLEELSKAVRQDRAASAKRVAVLEAQLAAAKAELSSLRESNQ